MPRKSETTHKNQNYVYSINTNKTNTKLTALNNKSLYNKNQENRYKNKKVILHLLSILNHYSYLANSVVEHKNISNRSFSDFSSTSTLLIHPFIVISHRRLTKANVERNFYRRPLDLLNTLTYTTQPTHTSNFESITDIQQPWQDPGTKSKRQ